MTHYIYLHLMKKNRIKKIMHKDDDFRIVDSIFVSKLFDIHMQCIESSCLGENSRSKLILDAAEAVWTDAWSSRQPYPLARSFSRLMSIPISNLVFLLLIMSNHHFHSKKQQEVNMPNGHLSSI